MGDPFDFGPEFLGRVPLFAELQRLLAWKGGPINWNLSSQIASAVAAPREGAGARTIDATTASDAASHARLLVSSVLELDAPDVTVLGPVAWAESLGEGLRELLEAVAGRASAGIGDEGEFPPDVPNVVGEAVRAMGPMLHGAQSGNAIGTIAGESIGWPDLVLPIERDAAVLVASPLGRIVRERGLDERAALLAAMVRVCVDHAVASSFAGLRGRFLSAFLDLVATLEHDVAAFGDRVSELDPSDPDTLQNLMAGGIGIERSAASEAASRRVDAICALFAASVDRFVAACGAQAGLDPSTLDATASARAGEAASGIRSLMALNPAAPGLAEGFVGSIVAHGGFELLRIALDDPIAAPTDDELADPARWIERASS